MRALRADAPERVIYLGSFSKTIASGLRVGWALAPHAVRAKLVLAAESAILSHSNFCQLAVREYLTTQPWRAQIKSFQELYRERRDAMLDSLAAVMPEGCTWTRPNGTGAPRPFPDGPDCRRVRRRASARGERGTRHDRDQPAPGRVDGSGARPQHGEPGPSRARCFT
jgi:DNA-binding transcriptional MocR family regulator